MGLLLDLDYQAALLLFGRRIAIVTVLGDEVFLDALIQALLSLLVLFHLGFLVLQLLFLLLGLCRFEQGHFGGHCARHLLLLNHLLGNVGIMVQRESVVNEFRDDGGRLTSCVN